MKRRRADDRWWLTTVGLLLFGLGPGFGLYRSIVDGAIWRGPGYAPVILRAEKPHDYYSTLALFGFVTLVSIGGAIWHFVAIRRIRRRVAAAAGSTTR